MSKKESYEKKTEELLDPILKRFDFDLGDGEYVKEG
jgi:ribosome maturation factor RimP